MAQVPDKVLQWLYSVLHEYHDSRRSYQDVAATLSAYPSLSPRTEVYTHETGSSALLLTLSGTLPVSFRGTPYRFPVKIWLPQEYAREAPVVYVNPGRDMQVRPGQHVDVQGRVYHPYLRDWTAIRGGYGGDVVEFLGELARVFEREPPVVARQQRPQQAFEAGQQQSFAGSSAPPSLPPKPGRLSSSTPIEMPSANTPPPRPPKPGEEYADRASHLGPETGRDHLRDGPMLPPLPGERHEQLPTPHVYHNGHATPPRPHALSPPMQVYSNGRPPGLHHPPLPYQQQQYTQRTNHDRSPVSPVSPTAPRPDWRHGHAPPLPGPQFHQQQPLQQRAPAPPYFQQHQHHQQSYQQQIPQHLEQYLQSQGHPQYHQAISQAQRQIPKPSAPDLLTDPFDIALPTQQSAPDAPAPPIPPNPEKEHLLLAISSTLTSQAQHKVNQNITAITPLQAQQHALRQAYERLQQEITQLEHLSATLGNNENILRRSIQDCDRTIEDAKRKPQPPIDDVLVPTTVVANQLWALSAEEAGITEAMYVLQKGVDRGRVSGQDFVKQMRALGREAFLKKALARKAARGLGLDAG